MRWLHLSDIHMGRGTPGDAQSVALSLLSESIQRAVAGNNVDAVLMTGDLAHSGQATEYDRLAQEVIHPLRKIPELGNAAMIAVPGNHDLDCDAGCPLTWEDLGPSRQEAFFAETPKGQKLRSSRAAGFEQYALFCRSNGIQSFDPTVQVSTVVELAAHNACIRVVCLNTALFCDREKRADGYSPAPLPALSYRISSLPTPGTNIVLGHHPIGWFEFSQREPFKSQLIKSSAFYLHGHHHRVDAEFASMGLMSLGLPSAYHRTAFDSAPPSDFGNSFALCQLDPTQRTVDVIVYSWSQRVGKWILTTDLPANFHASSPTFNGGFRFHLVGSTAHRPSPLPAGGLAPPRPTALFLIGDPNEDSWRVILELLGAITRSTRLIPSGREAPEMYYDVIDNAGRHRIWVVGAHGHVLSLGEVERFNTVLDSEGLVSVRVVTVGGMSAEARTLYLQLRTRKAIEILQGQDLCDRMFRTLGPGVELHLDRLSEGDALADLFVYDRRKFVLVRDRLADDWFYVLDETGSILHETEDPVVRLREVRPSLQTRQYGPAANQSTVGASRPMPFDVDAYRRACYADANTVRYAGLATLGIRAPRIPLDQLYVRAQATASNDVEHELDIEQSISDFVETLQVADVLKAQLEQDLRRKYASAANAESGAARALYQRHGNVLVLGDPGSGKTCFIKSEILEYCAPQADPDSWYARHVPVYVPLAEAARGILDGKTVAEIASAAATRRGLFLPVQSLNALYEEGRIAFFFDGLDEVGSLEHKARVVGCLVSLFRDATPRGNRFVMSSRPAAVQSVELPEGLRSLNLKGLTEDEMRTLARRVIALRLSSAEGETKIDVAKLSPDEEQLVEKVLQDCRSQRGIGRLGSNPLLLTLLVMTYQNSGRLFARRHRVYAAALQTLVEVRNRDERVSSQTFSEVDLKRRLGALALKMLRQPDGPVVFVRAAAELVQRIMQSERAAPVPISVALRFIQEVADRTGILILHGPADDDASTLTFMHYSFAEYYAAIGLLQQWDTSSVFSLARDGRWRDVITLLAGINGEIADPHSLIEGIMDHRRSTDSVTLAHLVLALDCAIECDVPSERTLLALLAEARNALASGSLSIDAGLRFEVGQRLGRLYLNSGSPAITAFFIDGMSSGAPLLTAAYIDLWAHSCSVGPCSSDVLTKYRSLLVSDAPDVQLAILNAAPLARELRVPEVAGVVKTCLEADNMRRLAAAMALSSMPALAKELWADIRAKLSTEPTLIANKLARALVAAGLRPDGGADGRRDYLEALTHLEDFDASSTRPDAGTPITKESLDTMLTSPERQDRLIAIRMLPWLTREEDFVKARLMRLLGDVGLHHVERTAALSALRLSATVLPLLTEDELAGIARSSSKATQDVRVATYRLLAASPRQALARNLLLGRLANIGPSNDDEWRALVSNLARVADADERVVDAIMTPLRRMRRTRHGRGLELSAENRIALLRAIEEIHLDASPTDQRLLAGLADDYAQPADVRRGALLAFSVVANPTADAASLVVRTLSATADEFVPILGEVALNFLRNARRTLDRLKVVRTEVAAISDALISRHRRATEERGRGAFEGGVSDLREAIEEAEMCTATLNQLPVGAPTEGL